MGVDTKLLASNFIVWHLPLSIQAPAVVIDPVFRTNHSGRNSAYLARQLFTFRLQKVTID